jgi:hypothetical protein
MFCRLLSAYAGALFICRDWDARPMTPSGSAFACVPTIARRAAYQVRVDIQ